MAKDDYYVIVYKILAYLYTQLKKDKEIDVNMIQHDGGLCKIPEGYWKYIIRHLYDDNYIEGLTIQKMWGSFVINDLEYIQITPKGIDYLCNHTLMEKAKTFLKDIKEITPFI